MQSNIVKIGKYKLSFSLANLAFADRELKKRGLKPVLEIISTVLPNLVSLQTGDTKDIDLTGIDVETSTIFIWALLQTHHEQDYEDCLAGPLSEGLPQDWLKPLFAGVMDNMIADKDDDDPSEESEGNAKAR